MTAEEFDRELMVLAKKYVAAVAAAQAQYNESVDALVDAAKDVPEHLISGSVTNAVRFMESEGERLAKET